MSGTKRNSAKVSCAYVSSPVRVMRSMRCPSRSPTGMMREAELLTQGLRDINPARRDDDPIERGEAGPALGAVAKAGADAVAEFP